ncbi:acyl-CoA synthetase [Halogeometricum borinquense DSM 11551]|uniref:acetate--CoA ligase (ADP-forming) n=2 Tax=Halogeometricum borinquense TaxID=60847 RepID=E4NPM1_HALBP|nr:acetate--CoA ligase family protein [Halogeometricum borinquense]ADQ67691.1 acyl-CoA synthetase (NDP forming) [Halogeometricum borinquense DSM 11551]ELY23628.1 acyl-CoA synthetase [Halogeometricum borinquense DSM 11551]RYJ13364.1 CoA-binding protein [Halogeometricum borinquense]
MGELSELFAPRRIAVVGATEREGSVGRAIMENLVADFDGDVVPVNPKYDEVFGVPAVADVGESDADLAVIVVPPHIAVDAVRESGKAGIRNVVVVTAGFGETGSEGASREQELTEVAEEYDLNLVGPNSLGLMSTPTGLNATFGPDNALPGNMSFMSQSGAFITAVLDWANDQGIGFKDVVSLGNKAVLDEADFVDAWGDDEDTEVIIGYLEGISEGREFIDTAREVTQDTPIVLVKSGRTDAGAQAASSHTGTIAGSDQAYEAGLDQAGVIRAESVQELFDAARVLESQPLPATDDVAVITNAGGPGVMSTDAVGDSRLSMASFTDETLDAFSEKLPAEGNIYNPVDIVGDADNERFRDALDLALGDENVGCAVVLTAPTAVLDYEQLAADTVELQEKYDKPVAACFMGGERVKPAAEALSDAGIPNYFDPARAVNGLDALSRFREISEREFDEPTTFDVDRERAREILSSVEGRDDTRLGVEAMDLLDAYGIQTPDGDIVDAPAEALEVAEDIEGDVVMKIVSPDILHKSDIGGVKVGVPNEEVYDAYEDLVTRARNYQPDANIIGVQVQEMVDLDSGVETIVGMNRDPQFGPLLMFGLGGIFVEVLEDTTFRVAPVSESEAHEMTEEIDSAPLLRGARGRDPVDVAGVTETIQRLSQLVTDFPAILELDINPLVATPDGVQAVDVRLTVDPDQL